MRECDGAVGSVRGAFGSAKNAKFKAVWPDGGFADDMPNKRIVMRYRRYFGAGADKEIKKRFVQ